MESRYGENVEVSDGASEDESDTDGVPNTQDMEFVVPDHHSEASSHGKRSRKRRSVSDGTASDASFSGHAKFSKRRKTTVHNSPNVAGPNPNGGSLDTPVIGTITSVRSGDRSFVPSASV